MRAALALLIASTTAAHAGATFETNLGVGVVHARPDSGDSATEVGFAAPDLAVGAKLGERLIIAGRLSVILLDGVSYVFVGPTIQYWLCRRWFLGGGIGLAGLEYDETRPDKVTGYQGLGVDLRVGFNLRPQSRHAITISLEVTPSYFPEELATGTALLAGYQFW